MFPAHRKGWVPGNSAMPTSLMSWMGFKKWSRILPVTFVVLRIWASLILQVGADLVQEKIPGNFFVSWVTLCWSIQKEPSDAVNWLKKLQNFSIDVELNHFLLGSVSKLICNGIFLTCGLRYRYCRMLEEGSFRGRTADFVFMFLFGGLLMTVSFLF